MVKVNLKGRLGNQLFQIAFAFLLRKSNSELIIVRCTSHFGYWLEIFDIPFFSNRNLKKPFSLFLNRITYQAVSHEVVIDGNSCLESNIAVRPTSDNILLDGFFQDGLTFTGRSKFFFDLFPIKEKYSNKFNELFKKLGLGEIIVVNFRLKEYKSAYFEEIDSTAALSKDWYLRAINKIELCKYRFHIVISDDIEEARHLSSGLLKNPIFIDEDYFIDFQFLMHGDCLIIPNSSFSWWGAFLNQKPNKKVYAPMNWVGFNAGIEYPKGIMINEFIWVD